MAHSKLHIICGNCGSNDEFIFKIDIKGRCDFHGKESPAVFITCKNCSTLHDLADFIKEEKPKKGKNNE